MEFINKTENQILPYTYLLKFNINNQIKYYYGVRYRNVELNLTPENDLFKKYFTSSKIVKNLLKENILPEKIIIHKTFSSINEACKFEINFLNKLNAKNRKDFLNQVNHFDNSLPMNKGRKMPKDAKIKIGKASKTRQSSKEYRAKRSKNMSEKWKDDKFKKYMKDKNDNFFKSDDGKKHIERLKTIWINKKHTKSTKEKMSKSAKETCKKIDCTARAMARKRYTCPECNKSNLDGANFNSHMISVHLWNKEKCQMFKIS